MGTGITKLLIIVTCLILSLQLGATNCSDIYFNSGRVNIGVCLNYQRYPYRYFYYEACIKVLDKYIEQKIAKGELEDKMFEIGIGDLIMTRPHCYVSQNKNAYHIQSTTSIELKDLLLIVDYFCQPGFKSFFADTFEIEGDEDFDRKMSIIDNFLSKDLSPEAEDILKNYVCTFWETKDLKVNFNNGVLYYTLFNKRLPHKFGNILPCNIHNRYIIQCDSAEYTFFVYQDSVLIKTFKPEIETPEFYRYEVYNKWINFFAEYSSDCNYSYSYENNRFYLIKPD